MPTRPAVSRPSYLDLDPELFNADLSNVPETLTTDLWETERERATAAREPLTAEAARRAATFCSLADHRQTAHTPEWRALIGPAFDHPEVAVLLASAEHGAKHHAVVMRTLAAHIDTDPLAAEVYARKARSDEENDRGFGACLTFSAEWAICAAALTFVTPSRSALVVALNENVRWMYRSPRNVGVLFGVRSPGMPSDLRRAVGENVRDVLETQAAAGSSVAAVLFAKGTLEHGGRLERAWELLQARAAEGNTYCAILLDKVAASCRSSQKRAEARATLLDMADQSAYVASQLLRHRNDPTVAHRLREVLPLHLDDPYCVAALADMVMNDPDHEQYDQAHEACRRLAVHDRYVSTYAAKMAETDEQRDEAFNAIVGWARLSNHQVASALQVARTDEQHEQLARHVQYQLDRDDQVVVCAVAKFAPERYDRDQFIPQLLEGACNGDRASTAHLSKQLGGASDPAPLLRDIVAAAREGDMALGAFVYLLQSNPDVVNGNLGVLLDVAADMPAAAAALVSVVNDPAADLWDVMVRHAKGGHAHCLTRLPALADGDPDRVTIAWGLLVHAAETNPQCAATLPKLARDDEQRERAWQLLYRHAAESADAASAMVSFAQTSARRDDVWRFCAAHANRDSYCASALSKLATTARERTFAFNACVNHQDRPAMVLSMMRLAASPAELDQTWDAVRLLLDHPMVLGRAARFVWAPEQRDLVRTVAARKADRFSDAAFVYAQLVETNEQREQAWDLLAAHADTDPMCAVGLWRMAAGPTQESHARRAVWAHARSGSDPALSMVTKVARDEQEHAEAVEMLAAAAPLSPHAATAFAAAVDVNSPYAKQAWAACVRHVNEGNADCATALPRLSYSNPDWVDMSLALTMQVALEYRNAVVATSLVHHVQGKDMERLAALMLELADLSPEAAVGLYSLWKRGVDVPYGTLRRVLLRHADRYPLAAAVFAEVADQERDVQRAWEMNVRHRWQHECAAHAMGVLARTREDADMAAEALRHWGRGDDVGELHDRVTTYLLGDAGLSVA